MTATHILPKQQTEGPYDFIFGSFNINKFPVETTNPETDENFYLRAVIVKHIEPFITL